MPRGDITINGTTYEAEPFEWPRSAWELLRVRLTTTTGWRYLTKVNLDALNVLYNGAQGGVTSGLKGLIVQYVEGTGPAASFVVSDWRGNSGSFVFVPVTGLRVEEVHGAAEDAPLTGGFWTAEIELVKV
jgi:hypothetical protein